jgi:dipeptidyl-peptidase-3
MTIGYICASCGVNHAREETADADVAFMCPPCGQNKAPPLDMSIYTIPLETEVVMLEAKDAFDLLTPKEQAYAGALAKADWEGAKICLLQCSPESAAIFALLQLVFSAQPVAALIAAAKAKGVSDEEVSQSLMYAASFYGNLGNYKSFGDTKFVPALAAERFLVFLTAGAADIDQVEMLWQNVCERLYSLPPRHRQMGLGKAKGISTYFSANCEEEDAEIAGRFLDSIGLSPYNTRLFKSAEGNYEVKVASCATESGDDDVGKVCKEHSFEGKTFKVTRGDYAAIMSRVVAALAEATPHVANDQQKAMIERYIDSFRLGSIEEHKNASRHWIKDLGPSVESYIGFIESYRDPSGVRGEWEGFVSCVNKEVSRKFQVLVDNAESFLTLMPWPKAFEKEKFIRPDFTSLEIISFGSSGVPAGINIPNYDDIREHEGFKNVSLGNVLKAGYGAGDKPVTFVTEADQAIFKKLKGDAFECQVGCHELLGHGSGRLFHRGTDAATAVQAVEHPLKDLMPDCSAITGPFYPEGSTWDSTFAKMASQYEECRAECSGLWLCLEPEVLKVFGHEDATTDAIHDISYVNWLLMCKAGLSGLEFYTPETGAWRQAHMNARYVILRVLLEAGGGLVTLARKSADDGDNVEVQLNRELIKTVGKEAIRKFLLKLQVFKSLGDFESGSRMFNAYSEVPEDMAELRKIVMARKEPRKVLVQGHVQTKAGGGLELKGFDNSPVGMIESFIARFPAEDPELLHLYNSDKPHVTD